MKKLVSSFLLCLFLSLNQIYPMQKANLKPKLIQLKASLVQLKGKLDALKNKLEGLKGKMVEKKDCPICGEEFTITDLLVPECGHIICKTCANSAASVFDLAIDNRDPLFLRCQVCKKQYNHEILKNLKNLVTNGAKYKEGMAYTNSSEMSAQERLHILNCLVKILENSKKENFRRCRTEKCVGSYMLGNDVDKILPGVVYQCPECKNWYCSDCQNPVDYEAELNRQMGANPDLLAIVPHPGKTCADIKRENEGEIEAVFPNTPEGNAAKDQAELDFLTQQKCPICGKSVAKGEGCQWLWSNVTGCHEFCFGCRSTDERNHHVWACRNGYICYYTRKKVADWMEDGKLNVTVRFGKEVNLDFSPDKYVSYMVKIIAPNPGIVAGQYIFEFAKYLKDDGKKIDKDIKVEFEMRKFNGGIDDVKIDVPEVRIITGMSKDQVQQLIDKANKNFNAGIMGEYKQWLLPAWYKRLYGIK